MRQEKKKEIIRKQFIAKDAYTTFGERTIRRILKLVKSSHEGVQIICFITNSKIFKYR